MRRPLQTCANSAMAQTRWGCRVLEIQSLKRTSPSVLVIEPLQRLSSGPYGCPSPNRANCTSADSRPYYFARFHPLWARSALHSRAHFWTEKAQRTIVGTRSAIFLQCMEIGHSTGNVGMFPPFLDDRGTGQGEAGEIPVTGEERLIQRETSI